MAEEGIVNLGGSDKLNINTTTAKGLEKVIGVVARFIISAQQRSNKILYGTRRRPDPNAAKFTNALNKGIIKILKDLSSVDFCYILNYLLNDIKIGQVSFDPENPPKEDAPIILKRKWNIQKKAYDYQKLIDKYYIEYGSATGENSRLGLSNLVKSINLAIDSLTGRNGLGDPEFTKSFPEISLIINFLNNAKKRFNGYTNIQTIPIGEVQDILKWIQQFRQVLVSIQAINVPGNLIGTIDNFAGGAVQEQLKKVNDFLDTPDRLIPRVKDLLNLVKNISSVGRTILRYISLVQTIVTVCLLLIRIFNVLKAYILTLPFPNILTTLGITAITDKTYKEVLTEQGDKKLITRLSQINLVLTLMVMFATSLVAAMDQMILILTSILRNLQSCTRQNDELKKEIDAAITELKEVSEPLKKFIDDANKADKNAQSTFGQYTIQIVKEELTDEGVTLRRRYGIALDKNKVMVVKSTPTFASLDIIIINEVKSLLIANGFVKTSMTTMSAEDQLTIMEAMKFVPDGDLSLDQVLSMESEGAADDQNSDTQDFVSNLPGGRAYRIKARKRMIKQNEDLIKDSAKTDPSGQYSKSIVNNKNEQIRKLKIANLKDEKKGLEIKIAALAVSAGGTIFIPPLAKRIQDINDELNSLNPPTKLTSQVIDIRKKRTELEANQVNKG